MEVGRRDVLALSAGALAAPAATLAADEALPSWPPAESFPLWPGAPPGAPARSIRPAGAVTGKPGEYRDYHMRGNARPDVGVFRPARPDGRAVLVTPGGGYEFVSLRNEGIDVARVLTARGFTVFVLSYRLPGEGWRDRANTPLADAQRAMRLIRASARRYGIDPAKLGVLGFSAGGHLAGSLATQHAARVYDAVDDADELSARPAFAGLIYAVSNVDPGRSHGGSRATLLGPEPDPAMRERYAVERNIRPGAPPLFILHTADDTVVPVENGVDLFNAARAASVPVDAHFPGTGGHGFGVRLPASEPASFWPELFMRWAAAVS